MQTDFTHVRQCRYPLPAFAATLGNSRASLCAQSSVHKKENSWCQVISEVITKATFSRILRTSHGKDNFSTPRLQATQRGHQGSGDLTGSAVSESKQSRPIAGGHVNCPMVGRQ